MISKAQSMSETKKPTEGTSEHFEAWTAEQRALAEAEATGLPELVALRKLARLAEHIFEVQGFCGRSTPPQILGEAIRCAQSDYAVLGDSTAVGSGTADRMSSTCRDAARSGLGTC